MIFSGVFSDANSSDLNGTLGVTVDPVVIAGRLEVLADDPMGVYYRISNGESVAVR